MWTTQDQRFPNILSLDDFEPRAQRVLPRMVYGYVSGAVETGAAARKAAAAYERLSFVPRMLMDVSSVDQSTTLFGVTYAAPFGLPPMGGSAVAAYRGDLALARAAMDKNLPMIISAAALIRLEDIHDAYPGSWFQAYLAGDCDRIDAMIDRLERAGIDVLVVTADVPVGGNRENNTRNGFTLPIRVKPQVVVDSLTHPRWLLGTMGRTILRHGVPHFENIEAMRGLPLFSNRLDRDFTRRDNLNWSHVEHIRRRWRGKLVIKGLLATSDVERARQTGADGVIISNHGGRQLDHAVAPLDVLPKIVADHPGFPVMVDGGIRRGTDVLKALALGAHFVFVGRPFLYAAAIGGRSAVVHGMSLLMEEIRRDMALLGVTKLEELTNDFVRPAADWPCSCAAWQFQAGSSPAALRLEASGPPN
jgi:L-lactate dehydrogenase (cytochrome)